MLAIGVGSNDKESFSAVRPTNVGSSNASPRDAMPQRGQVSEYFAEPARPVAGDVLQDDDSWS